jgi:hypothetical protein
MKFLLWISVVGGGFLLKREDADDPDGRVKRAAHTFFFVFVFPSFFHPIFSFVLFYFILFFPRL